MSKFTQTHIKIREKIEQMVEMIDRTNLGAAEHIKTLAEAYRIVKMAEYVYPEDGPAPSAEQAYDPSMSTDGTGKLN